MMNTSMTSTFRTTLIELLVPRDNPWLRNLTHRQEGPPDMVRIIRFGNGEEDSGEDGASSELLAVTKPHND
jgi:hypothetical protein